METSPSIAHTGGRGFFIMFDKDRADRVKQFIRSRCTHTSGEWAGKPFEILPWQEDMIDQMFGTVTNGGRRQYRFSYLEIPKKNGKTELAGAIALYMLCADGEQGAEVYMAAADREQAGLCFRAAEIMVANDEKLSKRLRVLSGRKRILDERTNSFLQVLSAEAFTKHGINPSCVIIDELHAHPNRELYDVLTSGTNYARAEQVVCILTTAGVFDPHSIWWEVRSHAIKVRDKIIEDNAFLPILYIADPHKDDPSDKKLWARVNPSLNRIFTLDKIANDHARVKDNPAELNNFNRFRLNIPALSEAQWIPTDVWKANSGGVDIEKLRGRIAFSALDLSSTTDLTALVHVFPPNKPTDKFIILPRFFMPKDNIMRRVKTDRVPYDQWVEQGHIIATPGATVDHEFIINQLMQDGALYKIREVAFDRFASAYVTSGLEKAGFMSEDEAGPFGIRIMIQFGQGYLSMGPAMKELEEVVHSNRMAHGDNPVLMWNASNVFVDYDNAGNMRPNKKKSTDRIDGIVALIMAMDRAVRHVGKPKQAPRISGV